MIWGDCGAGNVKYESKKALRASNTNSSFSNVIMIAEVEIYGGS